MKKILLMVAVAAAAMFGSCTGGKESAAVEANQNEVITKIKNCANPDSLSMYVDEAKAYAEQLVKDGKIDEAKEYLDKITPVVKEKAPALVSTLETVKDAIGKLPSAAEEAVTAAGDSVAATGEAVKDAAVETANDAVNAAKEGAQKGVDAVKEGAQNAASQATNAINNALSK